MSKSESADPTPKYVWVYWNFGGRFPEVERYELVKPNPKGSVTVRKRGRDVVIRPMQGKKFFFSEGDALAAYRRHVERSLEWARLGVAELEEAAAKPDCGMAVSVVPSEPRPAAKNPKT